MKCMEAVNEDEVVWKPIAQLVINVLKSFMAMQAFCVAGFGVVFPAHYGTLLHISTAESYASVIISIMLFASMKIRSYPFSALAVLCYAFLVASLATGVDYWNVKALYAGFAMLAVTLAGVKIWLWKIKV